MSSVQIVVHRGFKDIMYDNSMVGVLLAILKQKYTEFDILYVNGEWRLCHDFEALTMFNSRLVDLLELLRRHRDLVKKTVIIDVKWDFIKNNHDDIHDAIGRLKQILSGLGDLPLWVQAPNPKVLNVLMDHRINTLWRLGMIITNMDQFHSYKDFLHYVMVSLSDFSPDEIRSMSQECIVMGHTCKSIADVPQYKHLFKHIRGIVCDICL